ncbi:MAG: NTP transferase domain-containing protein [Candidatus Delongbacteria bacterium]|nr:NTP transferase domain-containing protein [Candidatus Delongbacteria bacterium]
MINNKENISCAILAGGKSKRMNGVNKALIEIGSANNLEKIINISNKLFAETLLITNDNLPYKKYDNIKLFSDIYKDIGPLGGIHSALKNSSYKSVFFFSNDMPFVNIDIVQEEIRIFEKFKCDIIIPRINKFIEPLHAIYSVSILETLEEHIKTADNYWIRSIFDKVNVNYWDLEDNKVNRKAFTNINTQQDLMKASDHK